MRLLYFKKYGCSGCRLIEDSFFNNKTKHPQLNNISYTTFTSFEDKQAIKFHNVTVFPTVFVVDGDNIIKKI